METPDTLPELPVIPSQPEIQHSDPGTPLRVPGNPEIVPGPEPGPLPQPAEIPQTMTFPE